MMNGNRNDGMPSVEAKGVNGIKSCMAIEIDEID
jgi:hypothetical protein